MATARSVRFMVHAGNSLRSTIIAVAVSAVFACAGCKSNPSRQLEVATDVERVRDQREPQRDRARGFSPVGHSTPAHVDDSIAQQSRNTTTAGREVHPPDRGRRRFDAARIPTRATDRLIYHAGFDRGESPTVDASTQKTPPPKVHSLFPPDADPNPPAPGNTIPIPLRTIPGSENVEIKASNNRLRFLKVRQAPLNAVLSLIAQHMQLNIVTASDVIEPVSVTLHDVPLNDALDSLMSIAGCTWTIRSGIVYVSKIKAASTADALVQGREIRVVPLNFTSGTEIEKSIKPMLSPVGKVFMLQSDPSDQRKTQDQIVIEDVPQNLRRLLAYVAQVDQPPRQVLIEAHILQVTLTDQLRHGVNFQTLQRIAGKEVALSAVGFANPLATPAALFSIQGSHLDVLVEALKDTVNAKTLASPKVMVVNGQRAKIQIGERLGYLVTTTTQTSTLQNVNFLDVGVVLEVTPRITGDGRVLMNVKPKVSGGQVTNGLPNEETTQIETTVMLRDGQGIIIGGLIQEFDDDRQSKLPLIGDMWLIGRLFQFRFARKDRKELIVALIPRIVPCGAPRDPQAEVEWQQASTRLFHGPLRRNDRPWEPIIPDAMRDPRRPRWDRFPHAISNLKESHPLPPDYYFPPASRNSRVRPTDLSDRDD